MQDTSIRVLIVEDSENDELLLIRNLKKGGYNPAYERVQTTTAMKKALQEKQWDIILCDYSLPTFNAPSAIAILKESNIDIPFIIVTGDVGEETAAECMRLGAQDYVLKGNLSRLCPAIARELEDAKVRNKEKQAEEKLRHEEQRFRALIEYSSDIIVILNLKGTITYINAAVERVLGFKAEERIGASGFELIHPDDMKFISDSFNILARDTNSPVIKTEMRLHHKDGSWRTLEAIGSNLINNNVIEAIIVNYRDITERKKMEDALQESERTYRELSIIDDLTQLYNSRNFYAQLEREIERSKRYGQPLTLLLLDLDKFKDFNDAYGHVEGDHVLSRLGQVVKRCLRETDSAYRYGGEEFTIMLPMTTSEEGIVTAKRIQTELRKEAFSPALGQEVYVTVSIGLAQYKPKEEMKAFVQRVDQLMYQAKKDGRDRICPEPQR